MKIVLQNLTRFGDLLQSQPALAELTAQGHEVAVACLENFSSAAALLPEAAAVFPLPGARFLAGVDGDWRQALAAAEDYAEGIAAGFGPECVVNLTSALSARLLARRLCGESVRGFTLDPFGFRRETSPWATFLEASSAKRGLSPFNVVDLFRKAAGAGQGPGVFRLRRPDASALAEAQACLVAGAPEHAGMFVGFQLGASAAARQWPVEAFARLGEMLWRTQGAVPVLLGGGNEKALAARYLECCAAPSVDLMGRTTLPQLSAVLCRLRLLVTNDTGTLHLAAGLDVPSISIFLATAQPVDTGPYREGCLCLEPDMPCHPCQFGQDCPTGNACLTAIGPATVAAAVASFLDAGCFPEGAYPGARAWVTRFDAMGMMDLASLSGHDVEPRAVWLRLARHVFRQFLDDIPFSPPCEPLPRLSDAERGPLLEVLEQSAGLLRLIESQAGLVARNAAMKSRFLATWERLRGLWTESSHLAVLGRLWMEEAQSGVSDLDHLVVRFRRFAGCVDAFASLVGRS